MLWHSRFIELAAHVAQWSKDPSTQCGAVIVRPDKTIASLGYNGFPRGIEDKVELLADRPRKYERVIHAEMNAILNAKESLDGYTLYCHPGGTSPSCTRCCVHVIQSGIKRVVHVHSPSDDPRRNGGEEGVALTLALYKEAGVEVVRLPS